MDFKSGQKDYKSGQGFQIGAKRFQIRAQISNQGETDFKSGRRLQSGQGLKIGVKHSATNLDMYHKCHINVSH